jgi:hypothetical protein
MQMMQGLEQLCSRLMKRSQRIESVVYQYSVVKAAKDRPQKEVQTARSESMQTCVSALNHLPFEGKFQPRLQ